MNATTTAVNQASPEKVSKGFMWSHALSMGGGFMLIQATVASYISVFITDTFGVPAGAASLIMLIATFWDAVNDPIMGTLADRTNTKFGRYRPYFLFFPVLMIIVSYFLFLAPQGLSDGQKIAYIAVFYILYGMLVTILQMPVMAVLPAQTLNTNERNKVITLGSICTAVAFTIAATFTPNMISMTGGSYAPWMLVYGVLTLIPFWLLFKTSTEQYLVKQEKRPILKDLKAIFRHKEMYPVLLVWCLASLGYGLMFSTSVYYMLYYMVRPDLIGPYMGVISLGALVSMMVFMPLALKIFKSGHKAFIATQSGAFVCYAILFFLGKNMTLLFVLSFIATAFASMQMALINIILNDTIDFIQLKEGISLNGTLSAIKGFSFKMGSTLNSSGVLAVLAATGYVAGAVGHQTEEALFGMNLMRFGIPALTCLAIILLLIKYPLAKYLPEIAKMKEDIQNS